MDARAHTHSQVYELKREGMEEVVTRGNFMEYINLVAHYKLNVQLHRQYQKFREGLEQVIPAMWLRLFSQSELQVLISGALVPIHVDDLRANTVYKGTYIVAHLLPSAAGGRGSARGDEC